MENVFDVCAFFINKGIREEHPITQISLQKLLYFSQGFHLGLKDKKLFNDTIYAWKYGPVVKTVYDKYRVFGNNTIREENADFIFYQFEFPGNPDKLSEETLELLTLLWNKLGKIPPFKLVAYTHKEGSPWFEILKEDDESFQEKDDIKRDLVIPIKKMHSYFKQFVKVA